MFNQSMYDYMINTTSCLPDANKMLSFYGKIIDRKRFIKDVENIAAYLQSIGVKKGDNVVICLGNLPSAVISFYAVNRCGAIANVLHPLTKDETLKKIENQMHPKCYIMFDEFYNSYSLFKDIDTNVILCSVLDYLLCLYKPFYGLYSAKRRKGIALSDKVVKFSKISATGFKKVDISGGDIAIYMHSSGTTGESKTACLSNAAYNHLADNLIRTAYDGKLKSGKEGMLMVLPMFHTFGLGVSLHASLCLGTRTILVPKFNTVYVSLLVKLSPVNIIPGVPNMFRKLAHCWLFNGRSLKKIIDCFCGGDKLPNDVKEEFEGKCQKAGSSLVIAEGYGLTECGVCLLNVQKEHKDGSIGKPVYGCDAKILDENDNEVEVGKIGYLYIKANSAMSGYYNDDKITSEWFYTGDMAFVDEDKNVFFVDREKRLIKIAGVNVFPQEIENIVNEIKEVNLSCAKECVINNKKAIRLYVELKEGITLNDQIKDEINLSINNKLLKYSKPKEIIQIDKMPINAIGKVDFNRLS